MLYDVLAGVVALTTRVFAQRCANNAADCAGVIVVARRKPELLRSDVTRMRRLLVERGERVRSRGVFCCGCVGSMGTTPRDTAFMCSFWRTCVAAYDAVFPLLLPLLLKRFLKHLSQLQLSEQV